MITISKPFAPKLAERAKLTFRAGDTVKVQVKIQEKGKTRLQAFEGLVLARKHGTEPGATFTVRKISNGVGVERIFPLYSPSIESVEIIKRAGVRRSKLYFLREKTAKQIRRKLRTIASFGRTKGLVVDESEMEDEVVEETPVETAEVTTDSKE